MKKNDAGAISHKPAPRVTKARNTKSTDRLVEQNEGQGKNRAFNFALYLLLYFVFRMVLYCLFDVIFS